MTTEKSDNIWNDIQKGVTKLYVNRKLETDQKKISGRRLEN